MPTSRTPLVALLLTALAIPIAAQQSDFRNWINSPEAYFVTSEELEEWKKVLTRQDAERFIEAYWRKRGDQFRREVRTRIDRADQLFRLPGKRGSETPRGRVWMILGSPNRQQTIRANTIEAGLPGQLQNNPVERAAIQTVRWFYQQDRLPRALGVPEMTVSFQTDTARGHQVIENPGLVEPYLRRAAAYFSQRQTLASTGRSPAVAATPAAPPAATADPLWEAKTDLGGTFFTGEAYLSATEQAFYAVSFYIPRSAQAFAPVTTALLVGLIRNEAGIQVGSVREQVPLAAYGKHGDRHVDRSFQLIPGKYTGTFALFTPEGTTMLANHRVAFELPKPSDFHISTLLPTSKVDVLEKQTAFDPFTFVATKYAVKGDRRFRPDEKVGFFTVISNPAGDRPSIAMSMKVSRDGKLLHKTPMEPAQLTQSGPHSWLLGPLFEAGTFDPGKYTLELLLKDMNAPADGAARAQGRSLVTEFEVLQ